MEYELNNQKYNVIIKRKSNKNTYIRVDENKNIIVTTNYFVTNTRIKKILDDNINFLNKTLNKKEKKGFYLMGKKCDIIFDESINIEVENNIIKVKNEKVLNKWYSNKIHEIFKERLDFYYNKFDENIPYPILKIRTMKTRWGVCNRRINSITLNLNLIKYDYDCLDYVIVHELSHFIHFDHSKNFWSLVEENEPNYRQIRKEMRE